MWGEALQLHKWLKWEKGGKELEQIVACSFWWLFVLCCWRCCVHMLDVYIYLCKASIPLYQKSHLSLISLVSIQIHINPNELNLLAHTHTWRCSCQGEMVSHQRQQQKSGQIVIEKKENTKKGDCEQGAEKGYRIIVTLKKLPPKWIVSFDSKKKNHFKNKIKIYNTKLSEFKTKVVWMVHTEPTKRVTQYRELRLRRHWKGTYHHM